MERMTLGMIGGCIDDTNARACLKKVAFRNTSIHFENRHWSHNTCQVPLGVLARQTQFTCVGFECRKMGLGPKDVAGFVRSEFPSTSSQSRCIADRHCAP